MDLLSSLDSGETVDGAAQPVRAPRRRNNNQTLKMAMIAAGGGAALLLITTVIAVAALWSVGAGSGPDDADKHNTQSASLASANDAQRDGRQPNQASGSSNTSRSSASSASDRNERSEPELARTSRSADNRAQTSSQSSKPGADASSNARSPVRAHSTPRRTPTATSSRRSSQSDNPQRDPNPFREWKLDVDPPAVPMPEGRAPRLRIPLASTDGAHVLFPRGVATFAAVPESYDDDGPRRVYDMRTGRVIGRIAGDVLDNHYRWKPIGRALSADGKWYATGGGNPTDDTWRVEVVPTRGRGGHSMNLTTGLDYCWLGLAADGRLIIGIDEGLYTMRFVAFKPGENRALWQTPTLRADEDHITLSPGGRYLVMSVADRNSSQIIALDTGTGERVGRLTGHADDHPRVGPVFSRDGAELAALYREDQTLKIWDADTGRLTDTLQVEEDSYTSGGSIAWVGEDGRYIMLPDGREDVVVIDRRNGNVVHEQELGHDLNRYTVSSEHVLTVERNDRRRSDVRALLTNAPLPMDRIAAASETRKAGGTLAEVGLPAIEPVDASGAKRMDPVPTLPENWPDLVDAPPEAASAVFRRPVHIPRVGRGNWLDMVHAVPAMGPALVYQSNMPEAGAVWVDLASRRRPRKLDLPGPQQPLALSPDGARGVFVTDRHRLDVFELRPLEHVAGGRSEQAWVDAFMPDNEHVITTNAEAKLVMWKLPELTPVYVIDDWHAPLTVSPGGRYMLYVGRGVQVIIWDLTTGKATAEFMPQRGVRTNKLTFAEQNMLMFDELLVDADTGAALWRYEGEPLSDSTPNATIAVFKDSGNRVTLAAHNLPHDTAARAIREQGRRTGVNPVVGPGKHVRLDIKNHPDAGKLRKAITERLRDAGMTVSKSSDIVLQVRHNVDSKSQTYEEIGSGKKQNVTIKKIHDRYAWRVAGEELWHGTVNLGSNDPGEMVHLREGETVQDVANRRAKRYGLGIASFPVRIMPAAEQTILGKSRLDILRVHDE